MIKYFMPTKIFWGKNCLQESGEFLKKIGTKPLIVTGRSSAQLSGALPELMQILYTLDFTFHHYAEIEENPELEIIHKGAEIFKAQNCDFVIGIGGGSPIDAAKAISVIAANNLKEREIYEAEKIKNAFPIIAIPTTSGTGTEVTPYSVVSDREQKKKAGFGNPLMFPALTFCDPKYTFSLPEKVTIDTALDALSHLLEGIYSKKRCDFLFPLIFNGIKTIIDNLQPTLSDPKNFYFREKLMSASLYGGFVIAQSSTTLQHSIGYPLTTHYGLSHGLANGIVMQQIMELYHPAIENELISLFRYLGMSRDTFYHWLNKWLPKTKLNLPEDFIEHASIEIMGSRNMAQNTLKISQDEIKAILHRL
ncbi:MAG: iron-containing alcohol dehydrogenase [Candidatus Cloacimonetes bacterium]|nr:iron-containing alcohol dehydrogenase [Candidatus Cloacimonadota bacterium]